MKIKKLGIEWGSAFEEAQPVELSHYGRKVLVFVDSNHDLVVQVDSGATIHHTCEGFDILITE